jgi:3-oxoacyl-[acyl-carrier-protein] synthase-3
VQKLIGAQHAACFDISVACTGFIYALNIADAFIQSGMHDKILIIGSEVMSTQVDWNDRSVCVLFGDGAGAVVLEKDEAGFNVASLHTDGARGEVLTCGARQKTEAEAISYIQMNGQEVFKFAVKSVPESIKEVLKKANTKIEDVKYFVLHQANIRIIEAVAKRLNMDMDRFPTNLEQYGNTSAASIPILLDEMNRNNKLNKGDLIVMSGFGAGLSWGSTLIKW